jgi:hypothetical protein
LPVQSGTFAVLSSAAATSYDLRIEAADCGRLLELLALVPDPRQRRGVRHSVAGVLAGSKSVLAVGEWAAEAPQVVLGALGSRRSPLTGRFIAPHGDTFQRVLRAVDGDALDMAIGAFLTERAGMGPPPAPDDAHRDHGNTDPSHDLGAHRDQPRDEPIVRALSVDDKAVRGARQVNGRMVHLLAAMLHDVPAVLAQRDVAHKTNEITQLKPLLDPLDLTGWVVTLDALHCRWGCSCTHSVILAEMIFMSSRHADLPMHHPM